MKKAETLTFKLTLTGDPALDLANTVDWRTGDHPRELLNSYVDLVAWGQHTGLLAKREASRLLDEALRHPVLASRALGQALELREHLYRLFSAVVKGQQVKDSDLEFLNRSLPEAMSRLKIGRRNGGYDWTWSGEVALERVWWPVVRAAAELLTSGDLKGLRECPGEGCGWLFIDQSRNQSRRWCSMEVCGNRAKARRHYELTKKD
ncbi:MAG TPA: ABATE domain-containing protein [Blastocatellia bacterium]|nr:ABATE domain-containing protein [Blastocatellia bacterium]